MRILHLSSARTLGGGERHLADLANALARRGHEVQVALRPSSPLRVELQELPDENIFHLKLRNALDVESALRLARLARERRIEIIHAHMARDYTLASYAARKSRARLIVTRHVLFPLGRLHALTLRHAACIIAVSRAVEQTLQQRRIFPPEKIAVIPNGVDTERFADFARDFDRAAFCRSLKIDPQRKLVGTIGEIKKLKGQEEFVRAAALIRERSPDTHFIIAGADASRAGEQRAALMRLINELHLAEHVSLFGHLPDIAPLIMSLDVFVSPSHTESFGLAIVEAMASGVAVVATATAGAREVVRDGETGVLVPIGDWRAMAEAVNALLADAHERKRIGNSARAAAHERFSLTRMVEATETVYRAALRLNQ